MAPVTGPTAGGTAVTLTGTNFQAGATVAVGGAAATSVVLVSATSITAVTPAGAAGAANVVVTNPDSQAATLVNGFTYTSGAAPAPTLASVSPASGPTAGGQLVTLSGTGFQTGASVTFGGTAATSVTVLSAGTLTCVTPATGTPGAVSVTITNPDTQSATLTGGYTYVAPPALSSISPTSGSSLGGTAVTLSGTSFQAGATVLVGASLATSVAVTGTTTITCATPAGTGTVNVTVTNPDTQSATLTNGYIYVAPAPTLASVAPSSGPTAGGTAVTLTGTGFLAGATVAVGGGAATSVSVVSGTTITCVTPAGSAGAANVVATNPDAQTATLSGGFTYVAPPVFSSVSPASGSASGGTAVTLSGTGFLPGATVLFGASLATSVSVVSSTTITCTTPAGTGSVTVTVTNPDGQSSTPLNAYTYWGPAPTLASVAPASGSSLGLTYVTLTGTGFQSGATVAFGSAAAPSVWFSSATRITCTTPAGTGTVPVTVTNSDTQSATLSAAFAYTAPPAPTVTSVSPNAGPLVGGQTVTISGTGFGIGATVLFGINGATGVSVPWSWTITCVVPAGMAGPATVTVTNPDAQSASLASGYTYVAPPTVTAVSPSSGDVSGGTPVTLTGTDFAPGATVQFGGSAATNVLVVSSTTIACQTPAGSAGAVSVTVTIPVGGSGGLASAFTYTTGGTVPTVSAVAPGSGPSAGGTLVSITGSGFVSGAGVTFGSATAASVTFLNSWTLTAVSPRWSAGDPLTVGVTVTNPGGASGSLANAFAYLPTGVEGLSDSAADPDVAVDGAGNAHVVWQATDSTGGTDIRHARSSDGGVTWSATPANLSGSSAPSARPRIVARGSTVFVVWNETVGTSRHVYHSASTDNGATWSAASSLANNGSLAPDPAVAMDGNANVVLAWRVAGNGGAVGISSSHGPVSGPFSTPVAVETSTSAAAGPPAIGAAGSGLALVVYDTAAVGPWRSPDIRVARSTDGGANFGTPQVVVSSSTSVRGPTTVALAGSVAVAVYREEVFWSQFLTVTVVAVRSVDGGATWGPPAVLASNWGLPSGYLGRPGAAVDGNGAFSATWDSFTGSRRDAMAARSTDGGRSFTTAANLSANSGDSLGHRAAGGAGGFTLHVWADDTALAGTFDVLSR
ncbi:MAG: IPT/TIG domain-containing protein [Planctomycetales bacterium]|nr:IPT/TIG domain-containing protein [Planctomycetales bacterium]